MLVVRTSVRSILRTEVRTTNQFYWRRARGTQAKMPE